MINFEIKTIDGKVYNLSSKKDSFVEVVEMIRDSMGFAALNGDDRNRYIFIPMSAMVYIKEL